MRAFPVSSTLHNLPFAASSRWCGTSDGSMVCAALSRKTSAAPTSSAARRSATKAGIEETPVTGGAVSGSADQSATAAPPNAAARSISMLRISLRRSVLSVMIPAGRAKTAQGSRSATATRATSKGSRVRSEAVQAQAMVAIPSPRLVSPLAAIKRRAGAPLIVAGACRSC